MIGRKPTNSRHERIGFFPDSNRTAPSCFLAVCLRARAAKTTGGTTSCAGRLCLIRSGESWMSSAARRRRSTPSARRYVTPGLLAIALFGLDQRLCKSPVVQLLLTRKGWCALCALFTVAFPSWQSVCRAVDAHKPLQCGVANSTCSFCCCVHRRRARRRWPSSRRSTPSRSASARLRWPGCVSTQAPLFSVGSLCPELADRFSCASSSFVAVASHSPCCGKSLHVASSLRDTAIFVG